MLCRQLPKFLGNLKPLSAGHIPEDRDLNYLFSSRPHKLGAYKLGAYKLGAYNIAYSFSSFIEVALFILRKDAIGAQEPVNGVQTPSMHFVHFKRILNPEVELEILVPNMPRFSNIIFNYPIQGQEGGISF